MTARGEKPTNDGEPTADGRMFYDVAHQKAEDKKERERRIEASDDPWEIISALFKSSAKLTITMYEKANRTGAVVDKRFFMEASRETRQLADRCLELIRERGTVAEAGDILSEMATRLEEIAPSLAASLSPVIEIAS